MDGSTSLAADAGAVLPIGEIGSLPLTLDLDQVLAGRLLVQGSSGAGKSRTLRRIVEEAFEYVTIMLVDPEGEFENLARHIGATTLRADEISPEGLSAAALRARHHRLALHLDLSDIEPDELIVKAAAFFAGLMNSPAEDWSNTVLVAIDEAHLLAPHLAASARDAETRRQGVAALTELCSRGRKRGIGTVVATPRLATLASSVVSTLRNVLIGFNLFDRDVGRAAAILGLSASEANRLRQLQPGEFFAFGPALSRRPQLARIGPSITVHTGATPDIVGPADLTADEAASLLDVDGLHDSGAAARPGRDRHGAARAIDSFLLEPSAAAAARIVDALRRIAPNATTAAELAKHLGLDGGAVDQALDLLAELGAVDTMPKGDARIARLSPRLRLRVVDAPVVGLS
ncbi:MAG: DUF87 domain-containing protein [Caulobacteraceae bacterium]|nr:DUF87 domain-containing protein [Caulobacteraceae bacterium]